MTTRTSLLFIALLLSISSFAQTSGSEPTQGKSLADIAREYREKKQHSSTPAPVQTQVQELADRIASVNEGGSEKQFVRTIRELFQEHNFKELDKEAAEARSTKARFEGGIWKIYLFYEIIGTPPSGRATTETEWQTYLSTLKSWIAAMPESVTARIALAEAYYDWGYQARGYGAANTVSEQSWETFGKRVELAKATLLEANQLSEKCPYWFEAMQHIAMAEGWEKPRARALLETAIAFEPGFYHYYREYEYYLTPKWYGEEGEAEAFINEISNKVGGEEGQFCISNSRLFCIASVTPTEWTQTSRRGRE
jgi:hypothetical protein